MQRRLFLTTTLSAVALLTMSRTSTLAKSIKMEGRMDTPERPEKKIPLSADDLKKWNLSKDQWHTRLNPEQFRVLREEGTERAHSSPLDKEYGKGTYVCAGCALPLFKSDTKYDSGTGWPSFWDYISGHLDFKTDFKLVWPRKEYHCARCGGHQGHVFDDGPEPTGLRYCNNGVALKFIKES